MNFSLLVSYNYSLNGDEEQVGGFDLVYKNGLIKFDPSCLYSTYLGAKNNREESLLKLAKTVKKRQSSGV